MLMTWQRMSWSSLVGAFIVVQIYLFQYLASLRYTNLSGMKILFILLYVYPLKGLIILGRFAAILKVRQLL